MTKQLESQGKEGFRPVLKQVADIDARHIVLVCARDTVEYSTVFRTEEFMIWCSSFLVSKSHTNIS